jgi:hypothetical protein
MKRIFFPLFVCVVLINTSCLRHKIEGNYHVITEDRSSSPFSELTCENDFEVYYSSGPNYMVSVEAEENLIPFVETGIHGNDMVVKTRDHIRFENHFPIKVFIQAPLINDVILSGSGHVYIDSVNVNDIHILLSGSGDIEANIYSNFLNTRISGSGNINLYGKTHQSELKISGSGEIYAYSLEQDTSFADISGSGNMKLWVADYLDAHISGSGKVFYHGNPVVNSHITGSGAVIHQ